MVRIRKVVSCNLVLATGLFLCPTQALVAQACPTQALVAQAAAPVPSPESVFGFKVGADFRLIDYDESIRYFQQLARTCDRIKLVDVGRTSNGHPWTLAIISSRENLARLDELTRISQ